MPAKRRPHRAAALTLALLIAAGLPALSGPAAAQSPDLVISQVYGGGGNTGATYTHDFIEVFNRGAAAVNVTGWSVQYASAAGGSWQRTVLSGAIQPGQYYLVQQAAGAGGTTPLPTPDATGAIAMSATAGKVALVTDDLPLSCGSISSCLPSSRIRDYVGYGSAASDFEGGGPTPTLSNTTAAIRAGSGCVDTDHNAADFTAGAPTPRNTASPLTTCGEPPDDPVTPITTIPEIQGSGHLSPLVGEEVRTTGIVTVILGNGFFVQDPEGDGDPATSDGLFVFTGSAGARQRQPGEKVEVRGVVTEFRPASRPRDLTLTELTQATVTSVSTGNPLPEPVTIDQRPDEDIVPHGMDSFEALEGMLVRITGPLVVGPTNQFGEFVTVAEGNRGSASARGNLLLRPLPGDRVDYNPERIVVDDEARVPGGTGSGVRINDPQVQVSVGQRATGHLVGAMDYQFSEYRVQASHDLTGILPPATPSAPALPGSAPYEARVATFNVENLFDCVSAPGKEDRASCSAADLAALETQLTKLAAAIEEELDTPELLVVEEIENTEVLTGDASGFVPGTSIPALLPRVDAPYDAFSLDSSDVRGIEVGFIWDTGRVRLHDGFLSTDVLLDVDGIWDGSGAYRSGREPLVGRFTVDDVDLWVVGIHLKSKGGPQFGVEDAENAGDDPLYGAFQPPVRWTEGLRHRQADYLRDLADHLLATDPLELMIAGDFNDFEFEEPREGPHTLQRATESATAPLVNLVESVPAADRYSFNFVGNSQALDHMTVTEGLADLHRGQAFAHFNADHPGSLASDPSTTLRASDHDPLVGWFCADLTPPEVSVGADPQVLWPPNKKLVEVRTTVDAEDALDPSPSVELVSVTSNETVTPSDVVVVDERTLRLRADRHPRGSGRIYTITYRATDGCGNAALGRATVTVPHNQGS